MSESTQIRRGTPQFRNTVLALLAAGFSSFAVLYCTQPLLPILAHDFGVDASQSSLSLSFATGALAPSMLIAGPLSDAIGRKPMMVAALLAAGLLTVLSAVLPGWTALLVVRALQGMVLSGVTSVTMAYVAEEMHASAIGLAMGLYISGNAMGGMSGRLFTGVLADLVSWRFALGATGVFALVCALMLWRFLPPSRHFRPRRLSLASLPAGFATALRDPGLPLLFAIAFLLMGGFVAVYNYAPFRLLAPPFSLSQAAVGAIFGLYIMGIASSSVAGALSARLGRKSLMLMSVGLMALGVALTLSANLVVLIGGVALMTFGFFAAHSTASAWVGRRAGAVKGAASALYLLFYYTGASLGGWVAGFFWSGFGWGGVVAFDGALFALALLIGLKLARLAE